MRSAKKIAFVRQAAIESGILNVAGLHARLEDLPAAKPFDVMVSRAFGSLGSLHCADAPLAGSGRRVGRSERTNAQRRDGAAARRSPSVSRGTCHGSGAGCRAPPGVDAQDSSHDKHRHAGSSIGATRPRSFASRTKRAVSARPPPRSTWQRVCRKSASGCCWWTSTPKAMQRWARASTSGHSTSRSTTSCWKRRQLLRRASVLKWAVTTSWAPTGSWPARRSNW